MGIVAKEPKMLSDVLKNIEELDLCRDDVFVAASEGAFIIGALFVIDPASDPMNPKATLWTGAGDPSGVLLASRSVTDLGERCPALVRGPATIALSGIEWPIGTAQAVKDAAIKALNKLGIAVKHTV
jgi:hypothetical protein